MSWGLGHQCYACKKFEACNDHKKIEEAIAQIHADKDHKGAGSIQMSCFNYEKREG